MRAFLVLLLACLPAVAGAQTMFKCLDAQKRVTYSNIPCDKQGLNTAGTVQDRVTSMPFTPPPKPAAAPSGTPGPGPAAPGGAKPAAPRVDAEVGGPAVQIRPVVPVLDKLVK
jgi:hypothetical protein